MDLKAWGPSTRGGPSEQMTLVELRLLQAYIPGVTLLDSASLVPRCDCHLVEGKAATLNKAMVAMPPAS